MGGGSSEPDPDPDPELLAVKRSEGLETLLPLPRPLNTWVALVRFNFPKLDKTEGTSLEVAPRAVETPMLHNVDWV